MSTERMTSSLVFADALQVQLEATGLSQRAAAEHLGVPLRTFEAWCMGTRKPQQYTQHNILLALDELRPTNKNE